MTVNKQAKAAPAGVPPAGWHPGTILAAPHRVGFFFAMVVLIVASLWWLLVQLGRMGIGTGAQPAIIPTYTHATIMVFGFMPLFFSGFLFTAGPNWMKAPKFTARQMLPALALQCLGWLLWLAGAFASFGLAVLGLVVALVGLAWMYRLFWRFMRVGTSTDMTHGYIIGWAGVFGIVCLAGVILSLLAGRYDLQLVFARSALWGFIVVTFSTVAQRMIPFFTHNVIKDIACWRPYWILAVLVGVAAFEVLAVWVDFAAPGATAWPTWTWICMLVEAVAGAIILWLVLRWGLLQAMGTPLLVMLHIGFLWFALSLFYMVLSQALWLATGRPLLGVGALHALAMGYLGSLIMAMVTRVTNGHSGRALVAGPLAWALFLVLQVTVLVRLYAAISGVAFGWTTVAAALWAGIFTIWGLRFLGWYGRPRVDGKPG